MGKVLVPHFGVHLSAPEFAALKQRLNDQNISYVDEPYIRFKGSDFEQETFFIADPAGNILEIKTMKHPEKLFD
ncbi:putative ring-cleaving dioxygenase [gamma proteobacterium IMCC2047]|nr:putative ring-cleaving dioxygenase [gamma proteobacterium IMCC2047]